MKLEIDVTYIVKNPYGFPLDKGREDAKKLAVFALDNASPPWDTLIRSQWLEQLRHLVDEGLSRLVERGYDPQAQEHPESLRDAPVRAGVVRMRGSAAVRAAAKLSAKGALVLILER